MGEEVELLLKAAEHFPEVELGRVWHLYIHQQYIKPKWFFIFVNHQNWRRTKEEFSTSIER